MTGPVSPRYSPFFGVSSAPTFMRNISQSSVGRMELGVVKDHLEMMELLQSKELKD